jgi:hypothetical protein
MFWAGSDTASFFVLHLRAVGVGYSNAMLKSLSLRHVGPAPALDLELAPRLNLITGDNGLGKSFLLDVAWWALSNEWPQDVNPKLNVGAMARPNRGEEGRIKFSMVTEDQKQRDYSTTEFNHQFQLWFNPNERELPESILAIYQQVDGSFSICDSKRFYAKQKMPYFRRDKSHTLVFSADEVWNGLDKDEHRFCEGFIRDVANWQRERGVAFDLFCAVLAQLSPSTDEQLVPGGLTRVSLNDVRDIPTIKMPYGQEVPVIHASSGIRRILTLAYMLVWTWQEHQHAAEITGQPLSKRMVFLIDEIEAHLHPRWQRVIVPALLEVAKLLSPEIQVQIIGTTHSPLVMSSVETRFDAGQDAWFDLDFVPATAEQPSNVTLSKREYQRLGDASRWLTSEAFDLTSSYPLDAAQVMDEVAQAWVNPDFSIEKARSIHVKLQAVLGELDPFWVRWNFLIDKRGWKL